MLTAPLAVELVSLGFAIGASLSTFSGKKVAGISGFLGLLLLLLGAGTGLDFVSHFSPHLLAEVIADRAADLRAAMCILPWRRRAGRRTGGAPRASSSARHRHSHGHA